MVGGEGGVNILAKKKTARRQGQPRKGHDQHGGDGTMQEMQHELVGAHRAAEGLYLIVSEI